MFPSFTISATQVAEMMASWQHPAPAPPRATLRAAAPAAAPKDRPHAPARLTRVAPVAPPFATVSSAARHLLTARAHVAAARSGKAAVTASGAASVFRALDGDARAAVVATARVFHDAEAEKPRIYRAQLFRFCGALWPNQAHTVVRFTQTRAFIASWVIDRGNHATSASDIVSFIKRAARARGEWELTACEEEELRADCRWLRPAFPEPPRPTRALSLCERERFYACCADAGDDGLLAAAIMSLSTGSQMRFTEVIGLKETDVTVVTHLGVLIAVIMDKTHKRELKPYPRVAPRLPLHFRLHDALPRVTQYLWSVGRPAGRPPTKGAPFFTRAGTTEALTAPYARALLLRFLHAARVEDADGLLDFSLHFARSTGFNDLSNKLFLGRLTAAEAGGWEEGGCVAESYQRRTAEDLACAIHRNLRAACRDFGWTMPPGTGPPGY
jgi:hypothetical protein